MFTGWKQILFGACRPKKIYQGLHKVFFILLQKPSLKSPPSVLSQGGTMSNFQAKYSLSAGFWDHTILISGNSSRLSWGTSPGGPGREVLHGAPAGVHPGWGVIGLSHRLHRFPMWATAVGRLRGTIWKQHDTLQCRTGIHCSGYRDRGTGYQEHKAGAEMSLGFEKVAIWSPFNGEQHLWLKMWSNWILAQEFFLQMSLSIQKIMSLIILCSNVLHKIVVAWCLLCTWLKNVLLWLELISL